MEDWLTTYEAVQISGYELDYIRKLVRAKKITGRKWGQSWQVSRKSLQEFLKDREQQGGKRGRKPKQEKNGSVK
jgi:excisionase family DNA binding protein